MKKKLLKIGIVILLLCIQIIPVNAKEDILEYVQSEYVYILNLDTNKVIAEKNADDKMYPASMTKIMTVYTALDYIEDYEEEIILGEDVFEGLVEANASVAGFELNEKVTIKELLYGVMLPSGADACKALAIHLVGSEEAFVEKMNEKVKQLGLEHTHFTNTTGLHEEEHYTTAKEMAIIFKNALQNDLFKEIICTKKFYTQNNLMMQSSMFKYIDKINADESLFQGGKTGFTFEAGHCLASISNPINQASYLVITGNAPGSFGEPTQVKDASNIYTYLKEHYEYKKIANKGDILYSINVKRLFKDKQIDYICENDLWEFKPLNEEIQINFTNNEIKEPIKKGDKIGDILIYSTEGEIDRIPFYAPQRILSRLRIICITGIGLILIYVIYKKKEGV